MSRRVWASYRWWFFLFCSLPVVLCGCSRRLASEVPNGALVVVPRATEIRRTAEYDGAIHYVVDDPYPGEVTVAYIDSAMGRARWRASGTSLLSFDGPEGGRTWWTYSKGTDTDVHQWDGSWSNDSGDLVTYVLRYEVSPRNTVARRMLVSAIYTTAATVKKLREAARGK